MMANGVDVVAPGEGVEGTLLLNDPDKPLMVFKAAQIVGGRISGDPRIIGVGCSTMADTDGDRFLPSALQDLVTHSLGLNVILNHVPMVPDNLFGSIMDARLEQRQEKGMTYDSVVIESDVILTNEQAVKTYNHIAGIGTRARRLGFSVGCIYTDAKRRVEKAFGRIGLDVVHCYPGEYSILPMPSNRLAWIEQVTKSMKAAGRYPDDPAEQRYMLVNRGDFVSSDTDAEGLMIWENLEMIATALEPFGVALARGV